MRDQWTFGCHSQRPCRNVWHDVFYEIYKLAILILFLFVQFVPSSAGCCSIVFVAPIVPPPSVSVETVMEIVLSGSSLAWEDWRRLETVRENRSLFLFKLKAGLLAKKTLSLRYKSVLTHIKGYIHFKSSRNISNKSTRLLLIKTQLTDLSP